MLCLVPPQLTLYVCNTFVKVLVVDFSGHLADISLHSEDLGYVQAKIASEMEMEAVRLAIEAHVPEAWSERFAYFLLVGSETVGR